MARVDRKCVTYDDLNVVTCGTGHALSFLQLPISVNALFQGNFVFNLIQNRWIPALGTFPLFALNDFIRPLAGYCPATSKTSNIRLFNKGVVVKNKIHSAADGHIINEVKRAFRII